MNSNIGMIEIHFQQKSEKPLCFFFFLHRVLDDEEPLAKYLVA